jgi:hypothetical protein
VLEELGLPYEAIFLEFGKHRMEWRDPNFSRRILLVGFL